MICEGETTRNGLRVQCGRPATVHWSKPVTKPGRSPAFEQHHYCDDCATVAQKAWGLTAVADAKQLIQDGRTAAAAALDENGDDLPLSEAERGRLTHAAIYGPNPVAHPYEPPTFAATNPTTWRCLRCGHPEDDRYHTHVMERARAARERALEGTAELVADPTASMRAVDVARAHAEADARGTPAPTLEERLASAVGSERGRLVLEEQRDAARALTGAHVVLERAARAWRGIDGGSSLQSLTAPLVAATDAVAAARERVERAQGLA